MAIIDTSAAPCYHAAMNSIENVLAELAGKKIAVLCVGNPLRGDDGFGPAVAARLEGPLVFDAQSVPENLLPTVARLGPDVVVFVDAADFGAPPGTLRLLLPEDLGGGTFSTHSASLSVAIAYLRADCGARSVLLAVQAKQTAFGSLMSVEVARAAEEAARLLRELLH